MGKAYFAGGCFWCTESDLRKLQGVTGAVSGYLGLQGSPSYESHNGFREGIEISYDDNLSFKKLCQFFLDHIDPTDNGGQFYDRGDNYKTAIYFQNDEESRIAESLITELEESKLYDKPIVVEVLPFNHFYKAEEYHQQYSLKNPGHYEAYKQGSGRGEFQAKVCAVRDEKKINWKD